jgi:hypothetical protein
MATPGALAAHRSNFYAGWNCAACNGCCLRGDHDDPVTLKNWSASCGICFHCWHLTGPGGISVPGAKVVLFNPQTGQQQITWIDEAGPPSAGLFEHFEHEGVMSDLHKPFVPHIFRQASNR